EMLGGGEGAEDVGGVAAGGEADEEVACVAEGFDLAREDLVEAEIVGGAGDDGGIAQRDGGEGAAVFLETGDELFGEMHGVGGGAAVAGDEDFAFALPAGFHCLGNFVELRREGGELRE